MAAKARSKSRAKRCVSNKGLATRACPTFARIAARRTGSRASSIAVAS